MQQEQSIFGLVWSAILDSYMDFLWAIPLVLAGIFITGSAYYFLFVRPLMPANERNLLRYLFPRENFRTTSAKVDIWVWVLNGVIIIPVIVVSVIFLSMVAGISFYDLVAGVAGPGVQVSEAIWALVLIQSLGYYFGAGFAQYTSHLAFHKIPVLWALHRAHHSAETANLFAFFRTHPLETLLAAMYRIVWASVGIGSAMYITGGKLLPETTSFLVVAGFFNVVAGFRSIDHSHIPVSYGPALNIVWGGPVMHQIHHSAELHQRDVNMAGAGYIYDWLFGTLYLPKQGETWRWGLNDEEMGENNPHQTVKAFFVEPLRDMGREIVKLGSGRRRQFTDAESTPAE